MKLKQSARPSPGSFEVGEDEPNCDVSVNFVGVSEKVSGKRDRLILLAIACHTGRLEVGRCHTHESESWGIRCAQAAKHANQGFRLDFDSQGKCPHNSKRKRLLWVLSSKNFQNNQWQFEWKVIIQRCQISPKVSTFVSSSCPCSVNSPYFCWRCAFCFPAAHATVYYVR